ncbi:MAG: lathosterol oxidase [Gammaproteobacteria bacterium]|jgi:lathosterol oxidase
MSVTDAEAVKEELISGTPAGESKSWNYHPEIPVQYSPLFNSPQNPAAAIKWFASAWLPFTELTIYLKIAIVVWNVVQPPIEETNSFELSWVSALWTRNSFMMIAIATALHLWSYSKNRQGSAYQFMRDSPTAEGE